MSTAAKAPTTDDSALPRGARTMTRAYEIIEHRHDVVIVGLAPAAPD
jgi:hypothetical protein